MTRKTYDVVKILENTKKNLENEINGYVADAARQQRVIEQLEQDRVKYKAEAATAKQKYLQVSIGLVTCHILKAYFYFLLAGCRGCEDGRYAHWAVTEENHGGRNSVEATAELV